MDSSATHSMVPRDGWHDGPHICTFLQGAQIKALILTKSHDCYDCTRQSDAGSALLWIGCEDDLAVSKKAVEQYFQRNGNGAS